jgi:hypothetical protein
VLKIERIVTVKKVTRYMFVALLLTGSFVAASAPMMPVGHGDGGSPVPLCPPWIKTCTLR